MALKYPEQRGFFLTQTLFTRHAKFDVQEYLGQEQRLRGVACGEETSRWTFQQFRALGLGFRVICI